MLENKIIERNRMKKALFITRELTKCNAGGSHSLVFVYCLLALS